MVVTIDVDRLFSGPARDVPGAAPALKEIPIRIELENRWSRHAAIGTRRVCRRAVLIGPYLT
jgi:hypothetical protein